MWFHVHHVVLVSLYPWEMLWSDSITICTSSRQWSTWNPRTYGLISCWRRMRVYCVSDMLYFPSFLSSSNMSCWSVGIWTFSNSFCCKGWNDWTDDHSWQQWYIDHTATILGAVRFLSLKATLKTDEMFVQLLRLVLSSTQASLVPSRQDASCHLCRPLVTVSIMPYM